MPLFSSLVDRAIRIAATAHHGQFRKATDLPYISHPAAVALILARAGFDEEHVLAAAWLHDVVEDTPVSIEQLATDFPMVVVDIVRVLSERKTEIDGAKRPWKDRKLEHLAEIRQAARDAKAVALADKLHNLGCMKLDAALEGQAMWERFNAEKQDILWYHREMIAAATDDDPRIEKLRAACCEIIDELQSSSP